MDFRVDNQVPPNHEQFSAAQQPVKQVQLHTRPLHAQDFAPVQQNSGFLDALTQLFGISRNQPAQESAQSRPFEQVLSQLIQSNVSDPQRAAALNVGIQALANYFSSTETGSALVSQYDALRSQLGELGIESRTLFDGFQLVQNWGRMNSSQRIAQGGVLGAQVLQNLGVLGSDDGSVYGQVAQAIGLLASPHLSGSDKALVAGQALAGLSDHPQAANLVGALGVIAGDGSSRDKMLALANLGLDTASAQGILSSSQATQVGSVLSAIGTVSNWSNMNDAQRISSVIQTSNAVMTQLGLQSSTTGVASAAGATALGRFASVAGIVQGGYEAYKTIRNMRDLPQSQAIKVGGIGLGMAGATIGAGVATTAMMTGAMVGSTVPIVGTAIGAVVGAAIGVCIAAFGSGKNTGQKMRDSWRDAMLEAGIATKIDGAHHVTLADGTKYNIGSDGKHKLQNVDGTERHTFDIDLSSPFAAETVPDAHLFAIATGIDPTTHDAHGLFDRATAQAWNAASSNASSPEEVRANFAAMLEQGGIGADTIAMRLELLRQTNKISEDEYTVYLSHLNQMLGTEFQPADREQTRAALVQQLSTQPDAGEQEQALLEELVSEEKQAASLAALAERQRGV